MRGIIAATLLTIAFACACGGGDGLSVATPTRSNATATPFLAGFESLIERQLRTPDVPSGTCPVTPSVLISPTLPMAVGDGPIYATGLGTQTVMNLRQRGNSDWKVSTITFMAAPSFSGKFLVRGDAVDGSAVVGFNYSPSTFENPESDALAFDTADVAAPGGQDWNYFYAEARIKSAGCYFFQIDTDGGTQTIIFSAE